MIIGIEGDDGLRVEANYDLHQAALADDVVMLRAAIARGANVMALDFDYIEEKAVPEGDGEYPLIAACRKGYKEIAHVLLDNGANPDLCSRTANSVRKYLGINELCAVTMAALNGDDELIEILVSNGADVDCRDSEGDTPLMVLASNYMVDFLPTVQKLIQLKADVNAQNKWGTSVLIHAVHHGDNRPNSLLAALITAGADPYMKTIQGETVFECAMISSCDYDLLFIRNFHRAKMDNARLDSQIEPQHVDHSGLLF